MCIRYETEHYRSLRSSGSEQASGFTMGTLFWQANDQWTGASWSAVEYGGRWKVLQYFARRFYADVLLAVDVRSDADGAVPAPPSAAGPAADARPVVVSVVSDTQAAAGATLTLQAVSWRRGQLPAMTAASNVTVAAGAAQVAWSGTVQAILDASGCEDATECFLTAQLTAANGTALAGAWQFLASPKRTTSMQDPKVTVTNVQAVTEHAAARHPFARHSAEVARAAGQPAPACFAVTFKTAAPAVGVWLETEVEGEFSDNAMAVAAGTHRVVFVQASGEPPVSAADLRQSITAKALFDRYA